MKKSIFSILLFISVSVKAQEIKATASSSVPSNTVYFVEGKVADSLSLSKIQPSAISAVSIIKRDTIVSAKKYVAQVFVLLKKDTSAGPPKNNK